MEGWWCVRHGDALAWVEAPSEAAALRRSLGLHALGDWTDDARQLVVFPQDANPEHAGPHDYTRAVPDVPSASAPAPPSRRRALPGGSVSRQACPPGPRRRARPGRSRLSVAQACIAAVLALGLVDAAVRSRATTTIETAGLPARRRGGTELRRFHVRIWRIST